MKNRLYFVYKRQGCRSPLLMILGVIFLSLLFTSCATRIIPKEMEGQIDWTVSFEQVKSDPNAHLGKTILVGGEIIGMHNKKETTEIEILQKPLGNDRRPLFVDESSGRFIYIHPTFLDPSIYKSGRKVTVVGMVEGARSQNLGEVEIVYPILAGKHLYLWPPYRPHPGEPSIGIGFGFSAVYGR